jgi:hypothetical protein
VSFKPAEEDEFQIGAGNQIHRQIGRADVIEIAGDLEGRKRGVSVRVGRRSNPWRKSEWQ